MFRLLCLTVAIAVAAAAPAAPHCPASYKVCDYSPGKYECCEAGKYCIPNVGCTCSSRQQPADDKLLVNFNNATKEYYQWFEQNDPVMGGQSYGNFSVVDQSCGESYGKFQGEVKVVPFLHAPGFCRATTGSIKIDDISDYLNGGLELTVRSATMSENPYTGFKFAFAAVGTPLHHGGHEAFGMFKADFTLPKDSVPSDWQFVKIPFNKFSWDWSDATGECTTKDPDGYQHHCCSATESKYCPDDKQLKAVTGFSIWAEGTAGVFELDVLTIAATMNMNTTIA